MRAATIYDVAKRAGVSHQTVSRLLAGFEGIRPETRERVEAALAELEYRPNSAARQLRAQRTNRIGVLADRVDQLGPARMIAGATQAARTHGYLLDVVVTDGMDPASIDEAVALVTEHRVAGVLATAQTEVMVDHLRRFPPTPHVAIDGRTPIGEGGPTVGIAAGRLAAEHLLDLGHRRVGYVTGPLAWLAATDRRRGFGDRMREGGGEVAWERVGDWTAVSGAAAWHGLSASEREVTAVATANDSTAIGFISAAAGDGVRVPEDLSVIGTDDLDEGRYLLPPLSTIAIDFEGEGRALIERLVAGIEEREQPAVYPAPPRLAARASTRPR